MRGGGDEDDLRAAPRRLRRDGIAHAPGGTVAEVAHGVERLLSSACGDDDAPPCKDLRRSEVTLDSGDDLLRLRQASRTRCTAREQPLCGRDHLYAAITQAHDVLLRDGVLPHARIHCGCDVERGARGKHGCCKEVVGDARRRLCDEIRRCGRDEDEIGKLGERDVLDVMRRNLHPHAGRDCLPRDLAKGQRRDKGRRRPRHDDADFGARLFQSACDLDRLICGDAARHAEYDAASRKSSHGQMLSL